MICADNLKPVRAGRGAPKLFSDRARFNAPLSFRAETLNKNKA
nr:MAG TPA: hypothetical protein [Caudoviricetes sp.]